MLNQKKRKKEENTQHDDTEKGENFQYDEPKKEEKALHVETQKGESSQQHYKAEKEEKLKHRKTRMLAIW